MAQNNFDKYITDKVLRFDFMLIDISPKTVVYKAAIKE